jgi:hypothetical protein
MPEERQGFSETRELKDPKGCKDCKDERCPCSPCSPLEPCCSLPYCSFPTLIIHGIPNRSTIMPNRTAQKVSSNGMLIFPPSASAL